MDTNVLTKPANIKQKFQLVKGDFSPSEASDVIMSLIDEKINFHQKQRLQNWEQNHKSNSDEIDVSVDFRIVSVFRQILSQDHFLSKVIMVYQ